MTNSVLKEIERLIEPVLEEMGIELVDLEYLSGQGRRVLRIYADRPTGINLDDCVAVSREIGPLLDVKDLLKQHYVLEVSSPGLDRPLKKESDFLRSIGRKVKIKTAVPLKGRRNFSGILQSFENGMLQLELDNSVVQVPMESVSKANLVFEFENWGILTFGWSKGMISDLKKVLDQVSREKGVDQTVLIGALEEAVKAAARKKYGNEYDLEVIYNDEMGEVEAFEFKEVVENVENDEPSDIL